MLQHALQLFDTEETLALGVCRIVREAVEADDAVMFVVTAPHLDAIRRASSQHGIDLDALTSASRLVVYDANETVHRLMQAGVVKWDRFDALVGASLGRLRASGAGIRVFGEAVDVLARRADFANAHRLEEFWNRVAADEPISVFCSYMAEHFGNPRDTRSLSAICNLHSHVHTDPDDILGGYLLKKTRAC